MKRKPGSLVKELSRIRSCGAASRLALAISGIAYGAGMSAVARFFAKALVADGERGCVTKDRVWFSWLRSAGRLEGALPILPHWRCVRRPSSDRSPRLLQDLITASTGTPTSAMSAITLSPTTLTRGIMLSDATMPLVAIATSRARRAGMPAWRKCRRGVSPTAMPASAMPVLHQAAIPAVWPVQADSVRRVSSPKRAVTSEATRRAAAASGAPGL